VYNERGTLKESINGFQFSATGVRVNPTSRTGWVNGPLGDQLQEFSY
jgi:hypothetical protein